MGLDAETPPCQIDAMDSIIPNVSSAKIVKPMPVIVHIVGLIGRPFGRSQPQIVIEVSGRIGGLTTSDVFAFLAVDMLESAKGPLVIEVNLSPGLQGITKATKINVADRIAKFLFKKTKESAEGKKLAGTSKVFRDLGIDDSGREKIKEVITHLDFRGHRILLPESVTDMAKFSEKDEYIVKVEGDKLVIRKSGVRKR